MPVNQPSYYSQYGPLLQDLASYQQKLHQQGLAPTYGQDLSPPFILTNSYNPYQPNYDQGPHNAPSYHHKKATTTAKPEHKGKHKFNNVVAGDKKNECEHAKKPIVEIDIKWPHIKHGNQTDKKHANSTIIKSLNETLNKIGDRVEVKVTAIKQLVDKAVDNINKTADGVYQQVGNESTRLIDKINRKLKAIERQLEKLKFGTVKSISDDFDENFEDDEGFDDAARSIDDKQAARKPNVVHSELGKKLRSMELLDMDAELRGDLKSSISDAVRNAQDKFNKLIDDQVAKINKKITDITEKFEEAFKKFQDALTKLPKPTLKPLPTKVYTPPAYSTTTQKYTTIHWKPKATTPIPTLPGKFFDSFTTPDYFKYTMPTPRYEQEAFEPNGGLMTDLNRMDANVDGLEIVDNAKDESASESAKSEPSVAATTAEKIDNTQEANAENSKPIDELQTEVDNAKALDDLQSQVLETVKDTLKSDDGIDNNQSELLANPEDKLKSDTDVEAALAEELRNQRKEDKLLDEKSEIDNSKANLDDLAESSKQEAEGDAETSQSFDDSVKLSDINEDIDGNEMRSVVDDNEEDSIDAVNDDEGKEEES